MLHPISREGCNTDRQAGANANVTSLSSLGRGLALLTPPRPQADAACVPTPGVSPQGSISSHSHHFI